MTHPDRAKRPLSLLLTVFEGEFCKGFTGTVQIHAYDIFCTLHQPQYDKLPCRRFVCMSRLALSLSDLV